MALKIFFLKKPKFRLHRLGAADARVRHRHNLAERRDVLRGSGGSDSEGKIKTFLILRSVKAK